MLKKHLLQRLSWGQAPKNIIMHFPGVITHQSSTHKPPICFHWCILMIYAVFDNFHALANPIRQDILRRGAENRRFWVFLTFLEFEFLMTYEVSRPLHRRKPFIVIFTVFPSVSRDYISLNGKFELQLSVFSNVNIKLLVTKTGSYIVYSSPNNFSRYIIV